MARPTKAAVEAPPARGAGGRSSVALLTVSLRPGQWTKNLFVLAGLLFGRRMLDPDSILLAVAALVIFCALSSAVYLFNDVIDREADRVHPLKSARPIASGALAPGIATSAAVALGAGGIAAAVLMRPLLGVVAATYVALLMLYSVFLKHLVIVDVLTIAAGFVLRAVAGAVAVSVPISHWLLVCTTLLALFLALSKRRHELTVLAGDATEHRRILQEYSPYLLDQMVGVVTASTLVAYAIYATSTETAERLGTDRLGLTIPFVLYGIFRYLYLVHQKRGGGSPAELLLADRPLLICVGLWGICVVLILYTPLGR
jgi:4-hydroxybenzoate polyprenyltransferase